MISLPNVQPAEKLEYSNSNLLDVVEIFPTIQGEGPFSGERAVFVRLAGCNLQCPLCDTDYTSNRQQMDHTRVIEEIEKAFTTFGSSRPDLFVVLTGGEPLRQNIGPFLHKFFSCRNNLYVQLETNGTLFRDDLPWFAIGLSVVCSPKTPKVDMNLHQFITAYKYVLEADYMDEDDGLPLRALGGVRPARPHHGFNKTVIVQPADEGDPEKNKANLEVCIESCKRFGHRLGIQLHKHLGMP